MKGGISMPKRYTRAMIGYIRASEIDWENRKRRMQRKNKPRKISKEEFRELCLNFLRKKAQTN